MFARTVESFDGTTISFTDSGGEGPAVALLHGASMTSITNFETHFGIAGDGRLGPIGGPTIASSLRENGARVIGIDTRGHGRSGRSSDPNRYRGDSHADDVRAVLEDLQIDMVDVVGYSMGSVTAARLFRDPSRLRSVALCGTSPSLVIGPRDDQDGLEPCGRCFQENAFADHPEFKPFRAFARLDPVHDFDSIGAALIGLDEAPRERLGRATFPVLVLNGGDDNGDNDAAALAALIPGATGCVVGSANHGMACSDPGFQGALLSFLQQHWPT